MTAVGRPQQGQVMGAVMLGGARGGGGSAWEQWEWWKGR